MKTTYEVTVDRFGGEITVNLHEVRASNSCVNRQQLLRAQSKAELRAKLLECLAACED